METTFGKTVETRRLKSNHNRSNCSLANLDTLNANADKINRFLANLLSESNAKNNTNSGYKCKTSSNANIYDSNTMIQFDTQLERINTELARAQLRNQLGNNTNNSSLTTTTSTVDLKMTNSGYLSDSECYATRLPSRLRITNRNDAAYFLDRSLNNNSSSNNNNNTQLEYLSNSNMKNSCINMQSAFKENNEFLLDNNNKLHRSNLCLKLNRFNNIINNNNCNNNTTNNIQIKQQQQYQNNLNILKQKKNEYYYNLIKTNQFNKLNATSNNISSKNTNLTVNNNRSFRFNNNKNSQTWVRNQENNSSSNSHNNMSNESKYLAQLLSPAVRTKLLHNQRRSNETLSMLDRQSIRETNLDECDSKSHYDSRNYLTWKNFNHTPETSRKLTENKINFEEELNQLKLKFKHKYVCDEYSIKSVENSNDNDRLEKESLIQEKSCMSMPDTPFLYNSFTLPKHSRFVDYKNRNEANSQTQIETKNDQTKIEVVPLENALLNMNEILKNLTLNSSKKVNDEFDTLKSNFKRNKEATSEFLLDDKLKELSPPLSTSTSISLSPPPPPYNPHHHQSQMNSNANQLSMSPSSSLSSSSYANSSKTSSSSASNSPCECLSEKSESTKSYERSFSLSISNSNQTARSQNLTSVANSQDFSKNLNNKKAEKTEPMSFGKKLKRFLSINSSSSKKSTSSDNERFETIKKKLFQLH